MEKQGKFLICDRRLYFDRQKKAIVEEGDDRAAFLYATPGAKIPEEMAERFDFDEAPVVKRGSKPENKAVDPSESEDKSTDWPLKKWTPEEYLEAKPEGPKADLAREIVGE